MTLRHCHYDDIIITAAAAPAYYAITPKSARYAKERHAMPMPR